MGGKIGGADLDRDEFALQVLLRLVVAHGRIGDVVREQVPFPQQAVKGARQGGIRLDEAETWRQDAVESHVLFGNLAMDVLLLGIQFFQGSREAVQQDGVQAAVRLQGSVNAQHVAESGTQDAVSGGGDDGHFQLGGKLLRGVFIGGTGFGRRPDGDALATGTHSFPEHRFHGREDDRFAAGHLEEGVHVELPIFRQERIREDKHLRAGLGKPGTGIRGIGISDCVNGGYHIPHGHFPEAVRAGGREAEVGSVVQVHQDVEGLASEIGQAVLRGMTVDVVHPVGGQKGGGEPDGGFGLADHGDGALGACGPVCMHEPEDAGRVGGELLDVRNRVPDHDRTLVAGDERHQEGQDGQDVLHMGHRFCKNTEISVYLQR